MGFPASTSAPWLSTANFIIRLNETIQRLPQKTTALARQMGQIGPDQVLKLGMWKTVSAASSTSTTTGVQVTVGSSTIYFPVDFDWPVSLYDVTHKRDIPTVTDVAKYHTTRLRDKTPGPAEAVEIGGFADVATGETTYRRRKATLYPSTVAGVTPSLELTYYRIPASIAADGSTYPDLDPKYEQGVIASIVAELSRAAGKEFERYASLEREMHIEMAAEAQAY